MNERQASAVTMNPIGTGGYDLMELRRKLELRMEYSKVALVLCAACRRRQKKPK